MKFESVTGQLFAELIAVGAPPVAPAKTLFLLSAFALFVQHSKHADVILVFVVLRVELFRCEALDQVASETCHLADDLRIPFTIAGAAFGQAS